MISSPATARIATALCLLSMWPVNTWLGSEPVQPTTAHSAAIHARFRVLIRSSCPPSARYLPTLRHIRHEGISLRLTDACGGTERGGDHAAAGVTPSRAHTSASGVSQWSSHGKKA